MAWQSLMMRSSLDSHIPAGCADLRLPHSFKHTLKVRAQLCRKVLQPRSHCTTLDAQR